MGHKGPREEGAKRAQLGPAGGQGTLEEAALHGFLKKGGSEKAPNDLGHSVGDPKDLNIMTVLKTLGGLSASNGHEMGLF